MDVQIGRYAVVEELARGNNGVVVRARAPEGGEVAIKVLKTHRRDDPEDLERFLHEARIAARLDHPNIVRLLDSGDSEHGPFQVVELVDGQDLQQVVAAAGPLPPRDAARVARDVARALAHAHASGVVHRDVKPANILLDAHGAARLTDFGLGRLIDPFSDRLTVSGDILGTPVYMSPEQAQGRKADVGPRSDIYGLGGTLYFLLTGVPPAGGATVEQVLLEVLHEPPTPPRALRPEVGATLEAICLRCLEKDPSERYLAAETLAADLDDYLSGKETDAGAERGDAAPARAGLLALAVGLPLLAVAVALAVALQDDPAPDRISGAAPPGPSATASGLPAPAPSAVAEARPLEPVLEQIDSALRTRNLAEAERAIEKAAALDPRDPRPHLRRYRLEEQRRDRHAAFEALQRAQARGGREQVEAILAKLYPDPVLSRLAWITFLPREGPLEEAALLTSKLLFDPELEVRHWIRELDTIARRLRPRLEGLEGEARLRRLAHLVGSEVVRGDERSYTDPQNSRLERVLDRRKGIHITCSLVLIALARRLDLPLQGVCFPSWFIARLPGRPPWFVDAYQARVLSEASLEATYEQMQRRGLQRKGRYRSSLAGPSTRQEIVVRLLWHLRNKLAQAEQRGEAARAERAVQALTPYGRKTIIARAFGER